MATPHSRLALPRSLLPPSHPGLQRHHPGRHRLGTWLGVLDGPGPRPERRQREGYDLPEPASRRAATGARSPELGSHFALEVALEFRHAEVRVHLTDQPDSTSRLRGIATNDGLASFLREAPTGSW